MQINDYGKLCTMMYEQLHPTADPQELAFYLSYAKPGEQMLELLCGSGRFLIPFWKKGLSIDGVDLSAQMLEQLEQKLPEAKPALHCCSADAYQTEKRYDYIFITCNSFSLFTDEELAKRVLKNAKRLLSEQGVFVFAVDTVSSAEQGDGALTQTTTSRWRTENCCGCAWVRGMSLPHRCSTTPASMNCGRERNCCTASRWIFRPSSTAWESWTHCWQRQAFAAGRSMTGLTSIPHKGMKRVPCCTSADKGV